MDTLAPDATCMIGMTGAELTGPAPIPYVHPAHWYDPPGVDGLAALRANVVDNRVMLAVGICGQDVGRFQSLVAQDGIPFTFPYPDAAAPYLIDNNHAFINERYENTVATLAADGTQRNIAAGKGRFGHSSPALTDLGHILAFHDSDNGAMLRFRFHDVVDEDGRVLLVATGGVTSSIMTADGTPRPTTWQDLDQLRQAEVSPEFLRVGSKLYYLALSIVFSGNTNTDLAESVQERMAASIVTPESFGTTEDLEHLAVFDPIVKATLEGLRPQPTPETEQTWKNVSDAMTTATPATLTLTGTINGLATASTTDEDLDPAAGSGDGGGVDAQPDQEEPMPADQLSISVPLDPAVLAQHGYVKAEPEPNPETPEQAERRKLIELADVELDLTPLNQAAIGDSNLAKVIQGKYDPDKETRFEFYRRLGKAAGRHEQTIRQWINSQTACPPIEALRAVAKEIDVAVGTLVSAAERDGCQRYADVDD